MRDIIKHKGMLNSTGQRIILIFNKIAEDPTNCIVLEYDRLTDAHRQNIMTLLESEKGQSVSEFYMALADMSFGDGAPMLNTLHERGYLKRAAISDVTLTPNNATRLPLEILLQVQDEEVVEPEVINDAIATADLKQHEELALSQSNEDIASQLLESAKHLELEASKKKEQAYVLCPSMRPDKGRPKLTKSEKEKRRVERNRMRRERYAEEKHKEQA